MNILTNRLDKSFNENILDMDYDSFITIIDLSLELLLGEY